MKISANTCTLSVLKPPNEAELMCQFLRQSCCHCVQPAFVSGTRGVFSLGECWSAELFRSGVMQGASCVSVLQGPPCVCISALPEAETEALDWGERAGRVSCLHCSGVGNGGIGNLPFGI